MQLKKVKPPAESEKSGIVIEAVGSTRAPRLPHKSGMNQDVFTLEEGDVTIQWPKTLSNASFQDLEDWLELIKRKAKRAVRESENKPFAFGDLSNYGPEVDGE